MFITIGEFGLRTIEATDLIWLRDLRNDKSTWENLEHVLPLNMSIQKTWLDDLSNDKSREYYIFTNDKNEDIGLVRVTSIDYINKKACIGLDISIKYRGKKLSKIAYRLIFDYLFNYLNLNRLYLFVLSENEVALNLYRKIGFIEEGRQREAIIRKDRKIDYIMLSILSHEYK
jgi:RimJ/RimL family protein N-acetyltransferase